MYILQEINIGNKVKVSEMGFMGLEDWYGRVTEIIDENNCTVDFGKDTILSPQFMIIHKSRISLDSVL
ncbi:hypothetical protein [Flagellimonas sp.]|uniref:hypothetical protein n=1 Tax=Flagellimonas sp. TaxID=2058762 RepID=UPI003BA9038E